MFIRFGKLILNTDMLAGAHITPREPENLYIEHPFGDRKLTYQTAEEAGEAFVELCDLLNTVNADYTAVPLANQSPDCDDCQHYKKDYPCKYKYCGRYGMDCDTARMSEKYCGFRGKSFTPNNTEEN